MFDNFLNVIIVVVALVVFIGRTVAQAKRARGKASPPQQKKPPAPVIFEDDDEDEPYRDLAYYVELEEKKAKEEAAAKKKAKAVPKKVPAERLVKDTVLIEPVSPFVVPRATPVPAAPRPVTLNLSHLSPLRQAVVMAEVLGPPKALQQ